MERGRERGGGKRGKILGERGEMILDKWREGFDWLGEGEVGFCLGCSKWLMEVPCRMSTFGRLNFFF